MQTIAGMVCVASWGGLLGAALGAGFVDAYWKRRRKKAVAIKSVRREKRSFLVLTEGGHWYRSELASATGG